MELGGKEMIKAVRFPGSSWCLRWVLIWEESEERLEPVPICPRPEPVWVADDTGAGWALAFARCVHSEWVQERVSECLVWWPTWQCTHVYKEEIFQLQEEGFRVLDI